MLTNPFRCLLQQSMCWCSLEHPYNTLFKHYCMQMAKTYPGLLSVLLIALSLKA